MTPQQKAKELVDKFYQFFPLNKDVNTTDGELHWEYNDWEQAKQCALIAVGEILNELDSQFHIQISYWHNVKHEIDQL
jgi:hypothetical protein